MVSFEEVTAEFRRRGFTTGHEVGYPLRVQKDKKAGYELIGKLTFQELDIIVRSSPTPEQACDTIYGKMTGQIPRELQSDATRETIHQEVANAIGNLSAEQLDALAQMKREAETGVAVEEPEPEPEAEPEELPEKPKYVPPQKRKKL